MEAMNFPQALRHYLTTGEHGRPTSLQELKVLITDKANRAAYVAELESYGYNITTA